MSNIKVPYNASYSRDQLIVNHLLLKKYSVTFVMSYGDGAALLRLRYCGDNAWCLYEYTDNEKFEYTCVYKYFDGVLHWLPQRRHDTSTISADWSEVIAKYLYDDLCNKKFGELSNVYIVTSLRKLECDYDK